METCNRRVAPKIYFNISSLLSFSFNPQIVLVLFSIYSHFCFLLCEDPWGVLPVCEWLCPTAMQVSLQRNANEGNSATRKQTYLRYLNLDCRLWLASPITCKWLSPWLAIELFLNSLIRIFTPLTTPSWAPSLSNIFAISMATCFQPVQHSRSGKTKLKKDGDEKKGGVDGEQGRTLWSCCPPTKWDAGEEKKGGEEREERGREEWRGAD